MEWWEILLIVWGVINVFSFMIHFIVWIDDKGTIKFGVNTPKFWFNKFKINWFGAIVLYILTFILATIWSVGSLLYLAFTTGRK